MIDQLVANFRIIREIGRGGFAVVYEAEHPLIHSRVAIKVLHSYHASDPDLVKRLFVEAQVVNRVNHPGLLRIENCGRLPDGAPYLIMELLRGETLRKRLDRGPLRANERALLRMVAETMSVAHEQGIIHRDLTPNNVMILEEPDPRIKVLDFGLAKVSEELRSRSDPRPQTVGMVGAVEYTAPEQWGDASQVTDKADVYALGVILYEALSGRRPFSGTPLQLMRLHNMERPPPLLEPNIPTELAALCLAMLEKKPEDRPTMRAVAEQLHPPVLKKSLNKVGNYLLHRELGKGGYGTVYEAVHEQLGDRRAIKILRPDTPASAVERFFNEARSASRAKHPHIVEIYDCGTADEHPYIIMELIPDGSLQDLLDRGKERPSLSIYRQIAEAMSVAHKRGIIHRDLKPDNIMLRRDGESFHAKVVDFGIAKLDEVQFGSVAKRVQSQKGTPLGTPRYMAPEQWNDASSISDRADVYSLGVMLYQLLSGELPFRGNNAMQLMMQHLTVEPSPLQQGGELAPLVMRMLSKDAKQRPSMEELAIALGSSQPQPPAPNPGTVPKEADPAANTIQLPRRPSFGWPKIASAVAATLSIIVGLYWTLSSRVSRMMPIRLDATVTTESVQTDGGSPSSPNLGQPDMRPNPTKSDSPSMPQAVPGPVQPILRERRVELSSVPKAALVVIDGKKVGLTPFWIRIHEPRKSLNIELKRPGFKAWRHTLSDSDIFEVFNKYEVLRLDVVLEPDTITPAVRRTDTAPRTKTDREVQRKSVVAPPNEADTNRKDLPGQLDDAAIFATIKQIDASDCKTLGSGGFLKIDLRIQRNGQADASAADGTREAACIAEKIKKLTFPEFRGPPMSKVFTYIL